MNNDRLKTSLTEFIEKNSKLFSALGVCFALTLFAKSIPIKFFSYTLSIVFFIASFIVLAEIFSNIAGSTGSWKVVIFEQLLLLALGLLLFDFVVEHLLLSYFLYTVVLLIIFLGLAFWLLPSLKIHDQRVLFYKNNKFKTYKFIFYLFYFFLVMLACIGLTALVSFLTAKYLSKPFSEMIDFYLTIIK